MATAFRDIVLAIRKQLVGRVLEDENRIIICARRKVPKLTGDADILLRLNGTQVVTSVEGQGRFFMKMRRVLEVIPRSRLATDELGKDNDWLTDEALGFLSLEDKVIDALELFQPTTPAAPIIQPAPTPDSNAAFLIIEPMRLLGIGGPDKDVDPDGKWGAAVQQWEVVYQQLLSATNPLDQTLQ